MDEEKKKQDHDEFRQHLAVNSVGMLMEYHDRYDKVNRFGTIVTVPHIINSRTTGKTVWECKVRRDDGQIDIAEMDSIPVKKE